MVMVAHSISARTKDLLDKALIIDMTGANAPVHPDGGINGFDSWISKYHKAGVTWLSMSAGYDETPAGEMVSFLSTDFRFIAERSDEFLFVNSLDDVRRAKREGKLALNFNYQGSNPLQGNVELIERERAPLE
jgi:membrane dipeptidase